MSVNKNGLLVGVLSFLLFFQIGVFETTQIVNAQSEIVVPDWIKGLGGFWSNGDISDKEFVAAIEYLIQSKIITSERLSIVDGVNNDTQDTDEEQEIEIPSWIRNNAKWFAKGIIPDSDFVLGLEYMVEEKIIQSPNIQIIDSENDSNENTVLNNDDTVPVVDSDNDGILDDVDACPTQAETINEFEDSDGCPDTVPVVDSDNDGILDDVDACPTQAETINEFEDSDGCPDTVPVVDSDNDGILDDVDACPTQAETINEFEDSDGCPDTVPVVDSDNDGILDDVDACPTQAETINEFEDSDGCPDTVPLPDKSLTISNVDIDWENSGWGDQNIYLSWTYSIDESESELPPSGHFVIEMSGIVTDTVNAEHDDENKYTGEINGIDPGIGGGTITMEIISFIGDEGWNYVGDGDKTDIVIPPHISEE